MSHPINLVHRYENRVKSGHYRAIGAEAARHYKEDLPEVDPYDRLGQVYATKVRLSVKLALIRDIVGQAVGVSDLSDIDAISVLVGWAAASRRQFPIELWATLDGESGEI